VLPRSPFATAAGRPSTASSRRWWRAPLLAALACLLALLIGFVAAWPLLSRPAAGTNPSARKRRTWSASSTRAVAPWARASSAGPAVAHRGQAIFARTGRGLTRPRAGSSRSCTARPTCWPTCCPCRSRRSPPGPAGPRPGRVGPANGEYRGRSVVFRRRGATRPAEPAGPGTYVVEVGDERVRVAPGDLALLHDLPLDDEPRLYLRRPLAQLPPRGGAGRG